MIEIIRNISMLIMCVSFLLLIYKLIPTKYQRCNPEIKYIDPSLAIRFIINKEKKQYRKLMKLNKKKSRKNKYKTKDLDKLYP